MQPYVPSYYQPYAQQPPSTEQQVQMLWQHITQMRAEIESLKQQVAALQRK